MSLYIPVLISWVNENTGSWAAWQLSQVCRAEQEIKTDVTKIFHKKESSLLYPTHSTDEQVKKRVREEKKNWYQMFVIC